MSEREREQGERIPEVEIYQSMSCPMSWQQIRRVWDRLDFEMNRQYGLKI